jgi:hypothetical protein
MVTKWLVVTIRAAQLIDIVVPISGNIFHSCGFSTGNWVTLMVL